MASGSSERPAIEGWAREVEERSLAVALQKTHLPQHRAKLAIGVSLQRYRSQEPRREPRLLRRDDQSSATYVAAPGHIRSHLGTLDYPSCAGAAPVQISLLHPAD